MSQWIGRIRRLRWEMGCAFDKSLELLPLVDVNSVPGWRSWLSVFFFFFFNFLAFYHKSIYLWNRLSKESLYKNTLYCCCIIFRVAKSSKMGGPVFFWTGSHASVHCVQEMFVYLHTDVWLKLGSCWRISHPRTGTKKITSRFSANISSRSALCVGVRDAPSQRPSCFRWPVLVDWKCCRKWRDKATSEKKNHKTMKLWINLGDVHGKKNEKTYIVRKIRYFFIP